MTDYFRQRTNHPLKNGHHAVDRAILKAIIS